MSSKKKTKTAAKAKSTTGAKKKGVADEGLLRREAQARILEHPDIEIRKSHFSNVEAFYVGTREIAHFHAGLEMDVRITKAEIRKSGYAKGTDPRVHVRSPSSDWVEVQFPKESDLGFLLELIGIAVRENAKAGRAR